MMFTVVPAKLVAQDTKQASPSIESLQSTIRDLRKELGEREAIIKKLESEDTLGRPVYPTVKRLRNTIIELNKTIKDQEKIIKRFKEKNLTRLKKVQQKAEEREKRLNQLQKELKDVKKARTTRDEGGMTVTLDDAILFEIGEATLKPSSKPTLNRLSEIISDYENYRVLVQGHTDDIPLSNAEFESNWELSAQRAVNVVEFLKTDSAIPGERLVAAGYGSFHPVVPNTSAENLAKNRRVEIKLVPVTALKPEENVNPDTGSGSTS
jgi:flagellar motor protein MotB